MKGIVKSEEYWKEQRDVIADAKENVKFGTKRKPYRYEPKSLIPSSWPALEAEMRKFVTPGFVVFEKRGRKCTTLMKQDE